MQENPILVHKDNGKWEMVSHKVKYAEHGITNESYTSNPDWYEKFAQIHDYFQLIEVVEMTYTDEQIERLHEVEEMTNLSDNVINNYVINGIIGEGLEIFALRKENNELKQLLADLAEVVLLGGA